MELLISTNESYIVSTASTALSDYVVRPAVMEVVKKKLGLLLMRGSETYNLVVKRLAGWRNR